MSLEAVPNVLLETLRALRSMQALSSFYLGGGTSLALRFAHRRSVDIDLFSTDSFDTESLLHAIKYRFSDTEVFNRTQGSLCLGVHGIKVDLLHHAYPLPAPPETVNGIPCASLPDLAAMKVNAVTNRGSKKDFTDLLLLHQKGVTLAEALEFFARKYGPSGKFLAIRSLQFFDDARLEPDPLFLNGWTWETVERTFAPLAAALS